MAAASYVAVLVALAAAALAVLCGMQFTTMPILFFGHIAAMLLCWCLMTSGSVVYVISKLWAGSRDSTRSLHAVIQSTALVAAVVGYACIFSNHRLVGGSQFGFDPGNPPAKTVHALFGYIVLGLMLLQGVQGWNKFLGLQAGKIRHLAHPLNGRVTLTLAACNMALILTTFPLDEVLFLTLAGGILITTLLAVALAGPAGKSGLASAREPKELNGEEFPAGYTPLE